jgi:hypothetical protein
MKNRIVFDRVDTGPRLSPPDMHASHFPYHVTCAFAPCYEIVASYNALKFCLLLRSYKKC